MIAAEDDFIARPNNQDPQSATGGAGDASLLVSPTAGGIFDGGLDTYQAVSQETYYHLLTSGLVVMDANSLLSLYKYHAQTRKELLDLLRLLQGQLWVPFQAMFEFWENRTTVIEDRAKELSLAITDLHKYRLQFEERIRSWANRINLAGDRTTEIVEIIGPAAERIERIILRLSSETAFDHALEDTAQDPVVSELSQILARNVGLPIPFEELQAVRNRARERYALEQPPGWKDSKKRKNPEGDYIIWHETLQEARRRKVDVLFVTGDVKEDWWRKEKGEAKGPLPELVRELHDIAGVQLYMLRPESLLLHAGHVLEEARISDESVQDAQRVSAENTRKTIHLAEMAYRHRLTAALLEMGYRVADLNQDFGFDMRIQDDRGRMANVELKISPSGSPIAKTTLSQVASIAEDSLLPILLISKTDFSSEAEDILRGRGNLRTVVWRDENDNSQLNAALQILFNMQS